MPPLWPLSTRPDCVFDPLVGLGIVLDAKQNRVPHLLCVIPLLLTMLAGPVGFMSYLLVRTATLGLRKLKRCPKLGSD